MWILAFIGLTGWISGYFTSRLYKLYNGASWLTASAAAGLILPCFLLLCFYFVEVIDWLERSSLAAPHTLFIKYVILSGNFNFLLVMVGSYVGFSMQTIKLPVKNSRFVRPLPRIPYYLYSIIAVPFLALIPSTVIIIELLVLITSIWAESYY